jgi:putative tricarboxylic transport membrane protein
MCWTARFAAGEGFTANAWTPDVMAMNKAEAIAGALVFGTGLLLLIYASRLVYLVENVPGPGFLPLWLGIGILTTGGILMAKAFRPAPADALRIEWPQRPGWIQIAVMLGSLALALYVLEPFGFLLTASLFIACLMFSLGVRAWPKLIGVPIVAAVVLHVVFVVWLGVPLPMGVLSFTE